MYKGKAIYNPSGKAGEYSYWACNFYVGCSNGCKYCYLKKGRSAQILGGDKPTLKKCFKGEDHALSVFIKELELNYKEIRKSGLFFTFTSDSFLEESFELTFNAITNCQYWDVPVLILTKTGLTEINFFEYSCHLCGVDNSRIAIGYSLTGHDELEINAATNNDRIKSMKIAKEEGFKTFASIEPIIDFESSKRMILESLPYCDLYKIGLESGKKYDIVEIQTFVEWLTEIDGPKIYLKESLQKKSGYKSSQLGRKFVDRDYNLFE